MPESKKPMELEPLRSTKEKQILNKLIGEIWPGGIHNPNLYVGIKRDEIKTIIGYAPREICALLGKSNEYTKIYKDEDIQTAQAIFQCEDITPTSQQPSLLSWFWRTPPTPTKRYSIKVEGKDDIILGITRERQQGVIYLDKADESKPLCKLAFFWSELNPGNDLQYFLEHLNTHIANHACQTQLSS